MERTRALVLAAGKGTRMNSDKPKVLHEILGQPLIRYVIDALTMDEIERIAVIVSPENEVLIKQALGNRVDYIVQEEQLGTGHAVQCADEWLKDFDGSVVVAVGDAPLITKEIIRELIHRQQEEQASLCFLTTVFKEQPPPWGRVVRDEEGHVLRIVEEKEATLQEKKIKEVSSSHYCFDWDCLFRALHFIDNKNAQGEYYLPDVVEHIVNNGHRVTTVTVSDPMVTFGINTVQDLKIAEDYLKKIRKHRKK